MDWLEEYEKMLEEHGPSFAAVGYTMRGCLSQYLALRETLGIAAGDTVLDVGCGLGYGRYILPDVDYRGIDASEKMIAEAEALGLGGDLSVGTIDDGEYLDPRDGAGCYAWVICAGIFNMGYHWKDVERVVHRGFDLCIKGLGIVFLREPMKPSEVLTYWTPTMWMQLGLELSPKVVVRSDWSPNQALMAVFRP